MHKFITTIALLLMSMACGSQTDSSLNADLVRSETGLQGKYQDGDLKGHHFFIHVNDQISSKAGFKTAVELVNDKKTLRPDRTNTVKLKDKQLLTVGYYINDRFHKFYEFFFVGEDQVFSDRFIVNFGKEFIDSGELSGNQIDYKLTGDLVSSPFIEIEYQGNGKFKIRVDSNP